MPGEEICVGGRGLDMCQRQPNNVLLSMFQELPVTIAHHP